MYGKLNGPIRPSRLALNVKNSYLLLDSMLFTASFYDARRRRLSRSTVA